MKRFFIIFLLSWFCYSGNSQTNSNLYTTWIPIGSINEEGEVSLTDFQQIITFKQDSIKVSFFGTENDTLLSYIIKGDSVFYAGVDTKLFLVNDSILKIDIYGETVVFKAINEGNDLYSTERLFTALKGTEWKLEGRKVEERYFSFDSITREKNMLKKGVENVYSFDRFDIYNSQIFQEFGFWTIKNVNGQVFLNLEVIYGSNDFRILQLKEIKHNEILFRSWISGKEENITLKKNPKLSGNEANMFNSKLTGSKWFLTSTKFLNDGLGSSLHSTEAYHQSIDTTLLIKKEDLKLNKISYQFDQDSTFSIFIGDRKAYFGTWSMLLGGRVIKLEEKWHSEREWYNLIEIENKTYERYLNIIRLKANEFHFFREEKIYTGLGAYEMEYVEQKYINKQ